MEVDRYALNLSIRAAASQRTFTMSNPNATQVRKKCRHCGYDLVTI